MINYVLLLTMLGAALARPQSTDLHEPHNGCPFEGHWLLPHEYDCTKFYYCEYGMKYIQPTDCAAGTEFSYKLQTCTHPHLANCILSGSESDSTQVQQETTIKPDSTNATNPPQSTEADSITYSPVPPTESDIEQQPTTNPDNTNPDIDCEYLDNGCPADFDVHKLLPHETDCDKFYYCVRGEKVERNCAPGTWFNAAIQVCDWPRNVECANPPDNESEENSEEDDKNDADENDEDEKDDDNIPENPVLPNGCPADFDVHKLIPHETECDKFYYCVFGEKVERTCANGTYFNYEIQVCDWPRNVNCSGNNDNIPIDDETNCGGSCGNGGIDNGDFDNVGTDNDGINCDNGNDEELVTLPNGCPSDFEVHQLLPHETNCSRFYYCVFGEKVERECAPGTHFNTMLQVCDWPQNAGCENTDKDNDCSGGCDNGGDNGNGDNDNSECNGENEDDSGDNNNNEDGDTCVNCKPVETLPNGCPADFNVHQLLPHETNCSRFYYCVFGEKVERDCAPGTHFNAILQVCDWPRDAGCETAIGDNNCSGSCDNSNDSESGDNDDGESGGGNDNNNGSEDNNEDGDNCVDYAPIEILPNGCPTDFNVHQLLPHETNCSRFYYCVFGEKVERECAPGTHFSTVLQTCDWPWKAGCETLDSGDNGCSGGCNDTGNDNGNGENDNGENDNDDDNNDNSETDNDNENDDGEKWDALPNGCPADFDVHHLLPHEANCSRFYYCVFGEKVERECAPGTHFNAILQVCDWPQNAGCEKTDNDGNCNGSCDNGGNGENGDNGDDESNGENDNNSEDNNNNEDGDTCVNCTPIETLPNGCPADFDVHQLLPHETNCSRFYYCVFGEKVERECAPGTHFNAILQVCDWPRDAGCEIASGDNNCNSGCDNGDNGGSGENDNGESGGGNDNNNGDEDNNAGGDNGVDCAPAEILPNGCPTDFNVHQLLPHETNCSRFYYCVFGEKVERECAPGTHFSTVLQTCDWPWKAGCETPDSGDNGCSGGGNDSGGNGNNNCNGENDNDSDNGENDNDDENNDNSETDNDNENDDGEKWDALPNGCPADFEVHHLLPHEANCSRFYYCVFGEKVERECAPGTHFNAILQVCDWPQNAGCEKTDNDGNCNGSCDNGGNGENGDNDDDESNGENDNNSEDNNNNEDGDSCVTCKPVEILPNGCPADFDVHQLLPHETNCSRFYYCVFGEKVERECAPGTHFNAILQVCDWPRDAGCEIESGDNNCNSGCDSGDNDGSGDNDNGESDGDDDINNGDEDNNEGGDNCVDCAPVEILPNGCPTDFNVHQLLPHETNCSRFYYCVFGEKVERECAPGTHFNALLQVCDWPSIAGCETNDSDTGCSSDCDNDGAGDNGISNENDSDNGEDCNDSEEDETGDDDENNDNNEDSGNNDNDEDDNNGNGDVGNSNNKCKVECNILPWAHESDCDKYWICNGDEPLQVVCSEGLHFNPNTHTCDFICNAGCVREDIQATAETDGVKLFLPWDKLDDNLFTLLP